MLMAGTIRGRMDETRRHLQLLTETIEAVNSTLDLEEVLGLVARKVADALGADACFVYLYDERADELVLRATHGTRVEEMTNARGCARPRGSPGVAAAEREPVMLPADAHLDPRFKPFPNLPEDRVPVDPRGADPRAREARGRAERPHDRAARVHAGEIDLLLAIAAQVAQSIQHARIYAAAQRRVDELEALARISEAVSDSLYLEESLAAIVQARRWTRSAPRARRSCSTTARSPGRRVAPARTPSGCRCAGAAGRSASSSATATRRSPTTTGSCSCRSPTTRPSRSSTGAR